MCMCMCICMCSKVDEGCMASMGCRWMDVVEVEVEVW